MWAMCGQRAGNVRATSAPRLGNSVPPWEPKTTTGGLDWSFLGPVPVPTIDGPLRSEGGHFKVTSDHCPGHVGAPFGQQLAALGTKNHDRVPGLEFLGPCPGPYNRWFAQERKGSISRLLLTTAPVAEHRGVPFTFLPRAHISKPCARCAIWNRTGGAPRPPPERGNDHGPPPDLALLQQTHEKYSGLLCWAAVGAKIARGAGRCQKQHQRLAQRPSEKCKETCTRRVVPWCCGG